MGGPRSVRREAETSATRLMRLRSCVPRKRPRPVAVRAQIVVRHARVMRRNIRGRHDSRITVLCNGLSGRSPPSARTSLLQWQSRLQRRRSLARPRRGDAPARTWSTMLSGPHVQRRLQGRYGARSTRTRPPSRQLTGLVTNRFARPAQAYPLGLHYGRRLHHRRAARLNRHCHVITGRSDMGIDAARVVHRDKQTSDDTLAGATAPGAGDDRRTRCLRGSVPINITSTSPCEMTCPCRYISLIPERIGRFKYHSGVNFGHRNGAQGSRS
ncbi:hypothetical protein BN1232_01126 [Mycobacterium lentiflavum]|uniref:Uncharacterized protein n=1 Tax=Mycobacterium lentiflavum TaxID=141349 RepID=A0A0E4CLV9_MYCLN|nr:hypothetical protein BN1232_01126 [Mycobacterium lentiflavum]